MRGGHLSPPPWTLPVLEGADRKFQDTNRPRGAASEHGTADRWAAGCGCVECSAAHSEDTSRRRRRQRTEWWAERETALLEGLADGLPYAEALSVADVSWQAITERRRRDDDFAGHLDDALMQGRPVVAHGAVCGLACGVSVSGVPGVAQWQSPVMWPSPQCVQRIRHVQSGGLDCS